MVGVLIFIDQNVPELALVLRGDVRKSPEQVNRFANKVVEVEGVIAAKLGLITAKNFCDYLGYRIILVNVSGKTLGIGQFVLGIRNCGRNPGRSQLMNVSA